MGQNVKEGTPPLPIVIEFLGLPGSGKSTLSHRVAERLRMQGIQIEEPSYKIAQQTYVPGVGTKIRQTIKLYKAMKYAIFRPIISLKGIKQIVDSKQSRLRDTANLAINLLYLSECNRKSQDHNVVYIFDQGMFQALCSVLYSARQPLGADKFSFFQILLQMIRPCRFVVISVHADTGTLITRIQKRGVLGSRLEQFAAVDDLSHKFQTFHRCILDTEQFIEEWASRSVQLESGSLRLIKIENGNDKSKENELFLERCIQTILNG